MKIENLQPGDVLIRRPEQPPFHPAWNFVTVLKVERWNGHGRGASEWIVTVKAINGKTGASTNIGYYYHKLDD